VSCARAGRVRGDGPWKRCRVDTQVARAGRRVRRSLPAQWVPATTQLTEVVVPMLDRPGVVAEITGAVSAAGCNIEGIDIDHETEDSALLVLVLTNDGNIARLERELVDLGYERGSRRWRMPRGARRSEVRSRAGERPAPGHDNGARGQVALASCGPVRCACRRRVESQRRAGQCGCPVDYCGGPLAGRRVDEDTKDSAEGLALVVRGWGERGPSAPAGPIDCGNSGTTARLLMGVLAGCR